MKIGFQRVYVWRLGLTCMIYTVNQMLKLIDGLILEENKNDKT